MAIHYTVHICSLFFISFSSLSFQYVAKLLLFINRDEYLALTPLYLGFILWFLILFDAKGEILTPDLHAKTFKNQLEINPEVVIIMSRKITEKVLLKVYKDHFNDEIYFDDIIVTLHNEQIINHNMSNLAHTIKAFGNKAVHANIDNPRVFTNKDALFVVGSLLDLLEALQTLNLLEKQ